jgi:molecular chaperone GrpE
VIKKTIEDAQPKSVPFSSSAPASAPEVSPAPPATLTAAVEANAPHQGSAPVNGELSDPQLTDVDALNAWLEASRAELSALKAKLEEREAALEQSQKLGCEAASKLQELHEQRVRAVADLENFRKRAQREREEALKFGQERLLRDMLPIIDNLERALDPKNSADLAALREGVEMTLKSFEATLARVGLKGFSALGQPFDPNLHEAIQAVESDEPPGTVLAQMVRGFTLNDRLIRPAMVFVAKPREATTTAPQPESEPVPESESSASEVAPTQAAPAAAVDKASAETSRQAGE